MMTFLVGLGVSLVMTGATIPLLSRVGAWDVANSRSSHVGAVVRGGGVGPMAGLVSGSLVAGFDGQLIGWAVLIWTVVMAAIGLLDDLFGLPAVPRLVGQSITAAAMSGLLASSTTHAWLGVVPVVVGGIWLVSYVNAFNFMDGINGISALSGAVAAGWYVWVGHRIGSTVLPVFGVALLGACLGFLPWNAPRARVFLGDVGSYGVGALVAALALVAWLDDAGLAWSLAPLVIYLADTGLVLIRRALRGDDVRDAHREHVYQRMVDGGWPHLVVAVLAAAAAGLVCLGVALLAAVPAVILGVLVIAGYLALPLLVRQRQAVG